MFSSLSRVLWQALLWVQCCPLPGSSTVVTPQGQWNLLPSPSFSLHHPFSLLSSFFLNLDFCTVIERENKMCVFQAWDEKLAPLHKSGVSGCREVFAEVSAKIYAFLLCKSSQGTKLLFLCYSLSVVRDVQNSFHFVSVLKNCPFNLTCSLFFPCSLQNICIFSSM